MFNNWDLRDLHDTRRILLDHPLIDPINSVQIFSYMDFCSKWSEPASLPESCLPSLSPGSLLPNSSLSQFGIRQGRYCQIQHFTVLQSVNFNFCHKHRSARHSLPIQIRIFSFTFLAFALCTPSCERNSE